jgi:hypothetical protein
MMTMEGDPLELSTVVFDLDDERAARRILSSHAAFEPDNEGGFTWLVPAEAYDRVLGRVSVSPDQLRLETYSVEHALLGKDVLEAALPGRLQHRLTSSTPIEPRLVDQMEDNEEESDLPPELAREALEQFLTRYYREWMDEPIPALGGRTPRLAARLELMRPQVMDLLRDIEHVMDRDRRAGRPAIDIGWMRRELGLE